MERTIINTVTGDRIHFWSSPMAGDGDELVFRTTLPPRAGGAPLHVHDSMTECFEVVSGALEIDCGIGRRTILGPGQSLTIAPGTAHGFRNPLDTETVFITTASPGVELERFLRHLFALANAGATGTDGMPRNPLALGALLAPLDMSMVGLPRTLQTGAIWLLARLARLSGADRRLSGMVSIPPAGGL